VLRRAEPAARAGRCRRGLPPQKGASAVTVPALEEGLARLAGVLRTATGRDAAALEWGGAAGGCAGGLYAAPGAVFMPGFDLLADLIGLDRYLAWPISSSSATAPWMRSS
jgi:glycerate kinase